MSPNQDDYKQKCIEIKISNFKFRANCLIFV